MKNKYRIVQIVGIFVIVMGIALIGYGNPKLVAQINPLEAEPAKPMISVMERLPPELLNATGEVDIIIELTEPAGAKAMDQQVGVMSQLQVMGGVIVGYTILTVNSIHTRVDASRLPEIAAMRDVYRIYKNERIAQIVGWDEMEIQMMEDSAVDMLNIDGLRSRGLDGSNILVAIMDTGVNTDLSIFQRNGESVVVDSYSVTGEEWVMWHGSAVASCVLSVAPDVGILDINVFQSDGTAWIADLLSGTEWLARYQRSHMDQFIISSNSWGITIDGWKPDTNDIICRQVSSIEDMGIPVFCACGNEGRTKEINIVSPAISSSCIAVAAVDESGSVASFSSVGPGVSPVERKPDVAAPGVAIEVADAESPPSGTRLVSGTSFSAPLVAGVCACIAEEYRDYRPSQFYDAIREGADDAGTAGYDYEYGFGIVDAEDSYRIMAGMTPLSTYSNAGIITSVVGAIIIVIPAVVRWKKIS